MDEYEFIAPWMKSIAEMTDTEFEKYSMEILKGYAETEKISNFQIIHDKKIKAHDGTYQIDVYAEFTVMNIKMKMLVECKHHSYPIERNVIAELHAKLESTGCHKGVVITNANYQCGAVEYAKAHGITLIQVFDKIWKFIVNAVPGSMDEHIAYLESLNRIYPPFYANIITGEGIFGDQVYPTQTMEKELRERAVQALPEQYRR